MTKRTKLELTWPGKDEEPRLEPRILIEDAAISHHAANRSRGDLFDNMLIKGDNLLALKALEADYAGKVKCVYIDPPFNTQQAFPNYDDGLEHSIWLSLLRDRLRLLHRLLSDHGTAFIHIDDNELGYLVLVCDEIFGRSNRVSIVTFKQGSATGHKSINPGVVTTSNFILIYAKSRTHWLPNRVFTQRGARDKRYGSFIWKRNEAPDEWEFTTLSKAFAASLGESEKGLKKRLKDYDALLDQFVLDNAPSVMQLARPDYNSVGAATRSLIDKSNENPSSVLKLERDGYSNIYLVGGQRILFYSDKLKLVDGEYVAGEPLTSIWDDVLSNNLHQEGGVEFPKGKNPKR